MNATAFRSTMTATLLALALAAHAGMASPQPAADAVSAEGPAASSAWTPGPAVPGVAGKPARRAPAAHPRQSGLDARVELLARELDLDAGQQARVRAILVRQREDVRAAWSNEAVPAQLRVEATRAIGARTADSIREVLTDKQREKYLKPAPERAGQGEGTSNLDSWINGVGSH